MWYTKTWSAAWITYFCHENIHKFANLLVLSHFRACGLYPLHIASPYAMYLLYTENFGVLFDKHPFERWARVHARKEISVICIFSIRDFHPFRNYVTLKMQQHLRCPISHTEISSLSGSRSSCCFSLQHENNLCNTKKTTCRMRRCDKKCTL